MALPYSIDPSVEVDYSIMHHQHQTQLANNHEWAYSAPTNASAIVEDDARRYRVYAHPSIQYVQQPIIPQQQQQLHPQHHQLLPVTTTTTTTATVIPRPFDEYFPPEVNSLYMQTGGPAPTLYDEGSASDLISDLSSPGDSLMNEQASYFPNPAVLHHQHHHVLPQGHPQFSPTTDTSSFMFAEAAHRPISPFGDQQQQQQQLQQLQHQQVTHPSHWIAYVNDPSTPAIINPLPSPASSPLHHHHINGSSTGHRSKSTPPAPSFSADGTVQLDCNGRKPRQWRNRKYKCSHCNLMFYDRDLGLYAAHIESVERAAAVAATPTSGSGRKFKCPEPSCAWHKIGFVRKLEQQKHHTRKHGNPTFECRFWTADGTEKYPGSGVCTTHWHADSGNRLRHERAVHGSVWNEDCERLAIMNRRP